MKTTVGHVHAQRREMHCTKFRTDDDDMTARVKRFIALRRQGRYRVFCSRVPTGFIDNDFVFVLKL